MERLGLEVEKDYRVLEIFNNSSLNFKKDIIIEFEGVEAQYLKLTYAKIQFKNGLLQEQLLRAFGFLKKL